MSSLRFLWTIQKKMCNKNRTFELGALDRNPGLKFVSVCVCTYTHALIYILIYFWGVKE